MTHSLYSLFHKKYGSDEVLIRNPDRVFIKKIILPSTVIFRAKFFEIVSIVRVEKYRSLIATHEVKSFRF